MTDAELTERLAALGPDRGGPAENALALCDAAYALGGAFSRVFGEPLPADVRSRIAHQAHALELVRAWVPRLEGSLLDQLTWRVEDRRMPIDLEWRKAELAAVRAARERAAVSVGAAAESAAIPPELAAEIERAPDDDEGYRVLGDALGRAGDPRGELIALQLAQDAPGATAETDRAAAAVFAAHRDRFLGPLADYLADVDDSPWRTQLRWRWGFIRGAKLGIQDPADHASAGRVAALLELVLRHPSSRFLGELAIGLTGYAGFRDNLAEICRTLAAHARPALRRLVLGDFEFPDDSDISAYHVGDLSPIWRLAHLEHVEVQGAVIELGAIDAPALRHFEIRSGGLPDAAARSISELRAPRLAHLRVYFGSVAYGGCSTVDDAAALLARDDLPELRVLGLCNAEFTDDLCANLARSPLVRGLERLDLSLGTMTDTGATELLGAADALARVRTIDISCNYVSAEACDELARVFGDRLVHRDQQDLDEGHYVSVSE